MEIHAALFARLRSDILTMSTTAASGHPTSSLSAVELLGMLFFHYLRFDVNNIQNPANDRVIFSKGHASVLYYALWAAAGQLSPEELATYRQFDSVLEGHPTRRFRFTEAATGSLGQGLSIGVGEALAIRKDYQLPLSGQMDTNVVVDGEEATSASFDATIPHPARLPRVYVLLGDGELAEGSVWEAVDLASHLKLNNLVAICDINRLGLAQETAIGHDVEVYRKRFEAFGWGVIVIDGHNPSEIDAAYQKALIYQDGPIAIIAKTMKGKGVSFLEDKDNWHGKVLTQDELAKALVEVGLVDLTKTYLIQVPDAHDAPPASEMPEQKEISLKTYTEKVATRKAFGATLVELGVDQPKLMVLDGDVMNSTFTDAFAKVYPEQFIECYIAEQVMVGVATGLWARGYVPWVATFAAFLTRAFDQLRMASVTGATIHVNGSHAGVSIGPDGASQMGLEDIAMFRTINGSTVVYPSDAYASQALTIGLMKVEGITYLRTTREATPMLYTPEDEFPIGGSKTHWGKVDQNEYHDGVLIIAAGITLFEALQAQKEAQEQGKTVVVVDAYSIKPIDVATITVLAQKSKQVIVVEDHYPEGGLGDVVAGVLTTSKIAVDFHHLAVRQKPRSGTKDELLAYEEINAAAILKVIG